MKRIFWLLVLLILKTGTGFADDVSVKLADVQEDRASTQGVFGPGPGFSGRLRNDFHWTLRLHPAQEKTISSILIEHAAAGEAWTTSSRRKYGKDLYPIVVYRNGEQVNDRYDAAIGPVGPGDVTLDLYGQIESAPFDGGTVVVEYTDGSSVKGTIPASDLLPEPLDVTGMTCNDSDKGANYNVPGKIVYSMGGGEERTFSDYCMDDKMVVEGVCGGRELRQFVVSHGLCSGGCLNGACIGAPAATDLEGSIRRLGDDIEFTFSTSRQRSIEFILVTGDQGSEVFDRIQNVSFIGEPLVMGNGGGSYVFEPGQYKIVLRPPQGGHFDHGKLRIVFTDGTRFVRDLQEKD